MSRVNVAVPSFTDLRADTLSKSTKAADAVWDQRAYRSLGGIMDVFPLDTIAQFTVDAQARKRALRPLQWNSIEIVSSRDPSPHTARRRSGERLSLAWVG